MDKDDPEVIGDEADDEFAVYRNGTKVSGGVCVIVLWWRWGRSLSSLIYLLFVLQMPKIMITTRPKCSKKLYDFVGDLMQMIPNAFYYPRGTLTVTKMAEYASNKEFTHLVILSEKNKVCNGMLISHLPEGPTAFFKVTAWCYLDVVHVINASFSIPSHNCTAFWCNECSQNCLCLCFALPPLSLPPSLSFSAFPLQQLSSFQPGSALPGHGRPTSHIPELILNNFDSRLGRRSGRFLGSLFPHVRSFIIRWIRPDQTCLMMGGVTLHCMF